MCVWLRQEKLRNNQRRPPHGGLCHVRTLRLKVRHFCSGQARRGLRYPVAGTRDTPPRGACGTPPVSLRIASHRHANDPAKGRER